MHHNSDEIKIQILINNVAGAWEESVIYMILDHISGRVHGLWCISRRLHYVTLGK